MVIGVMQASSQRERNALLFEATRAAAKGCEVVNFGVFGDEAGACSYVEIAVALSLLLSSGAVDFAVTGCSATVYFSCTQSLQTFGLRQASPPSFLLTVTQPQAIAATAAAIISLCIFILRCSVRNKSPARACSQSRP